MTAFSQPSPVSAAPSTAFPRVEVETAPPSRAPSPLASSDTRVYRNRELQPSAVEVADDTTPTPTPSIKQPQILLLDAQAFESVDTSGTQESPLEICGPPPHQQDLDLPKVEISIPAPQSTSPPPLSPTMHYYAPQPVEYGPSMNPAVPQYPYPYPAHMPMMPGAGPYYPNVFYNSPPTRQVEEQHPYDNVGQPHWAKPGTEDDRETLMQKVSSVLPDIQRLLSQYRGAHGEAPTKEGPLQLSEFECQAELNSVKIELDSAKKEYEKVIQSLVGDRGRLEREVFDLRQGVANLPLLVAECENLRNQVAYLEVGRKESVEGSEEVRSLKEELQAAKTANLNEIESLKSSVGTEEEVSSRKLLEIKDQHNDLLAAAEKEHFQTSSDQKNVILKLEKELANLAIKHATQQNDLKDIMKKDRQDMEARTAKISEDNGRKEMEWLRGMERLRAEMHAREDEVEQERRDHQKLRDVRSGETAKLVQLAGSIAKCRSKYVEMQREHDNIHRIMQSMGAAPIHRPERH